MEQWQTRTSSSARSAEKSEGMDNKDGKKSCWAEPQGGRGDTS